MTQMPVLKVPVTSSEDKATVTNIKKAPADKTTSKVDKSQNSISEHFSLPKSFNKAQPQADKPVGCGKISEMKRSESSKSLADYASDNDPNLTGGRQKRTNSKSFPPSKKNEKNKF